MGQGTFSARQQQNRQSLYNYDIPGFKAENVAATPGQLFAKFGGMRGFITQQLQREKIKAATEAAKNKKTPLEESLNLPMESMQVGDFVPVIFCRRREGGTGGVMVRPRATEFRFATDVLVDEGEGDRISALISKLFGFSLAIPIETHIIRAAYHCVLGEGYIYPVQTRDVRNGPNRQGDYSQNYNMRAGAWRPGVDNGAFLSKDGYILIDFPERCGGGGDYNGVSTIEFRNTYTASNIDGWKLHWSCFVRNGMRIDRGRVLDDVVGPSDNFCDLYIWAQISAGLMTEDDFDMNQMQKAAQFLEANQLFCNGEFREGTSLPDFLTSILPLFLLRETTIAGKFALIPVVPTNDDGTIKTTAITPAWRFDERSIAPGSYEDQWSTAASKRRVQVNCLWRQQSSDTEVPFVRDLQISADGVASPEVITLDMAQVATSEAHAAMAGGYRQAMLALGQGTASVRLLAGNQTGMLRAGMIIQILLSIVTEVEMPDLIREYWWIDSIRLDSDGSETLSLIHCPVDDQGRSLVALHVVAARDGIAGWEMPYPPIGAGDEEGRSTDQTVPPSTTSGVPYTAGGAGGAAGFNRSSPPGPGRNRPPRPPRDGGGDDGGGGGTVKTGGAGGSPTKPEEGPRYVITYNDFPIYGPYVFGPIKTHAWPGECKYGIYQLRTRIQGVYLGTVVDYIVVTIEEVQYEVVDTWAETVGEDIITFVRYLFRVQEQIPNAPRTFYVDSQEGGAVSYPLVVTPLDWQCKLRDGTPGPIRNPDSPPLT